MRPTKQVIIKRQIEEWVSRVWYPDVVPEKKVNENGELVLVDNPTYNKAYDNKFSCIFADETENIYKFLRYGIEQCKVYNSNILFARSSLLDAYILPDVPLREGYRFINELIEAIGPSVSGKWIVCDKINCDFSKQLAVYFITQLKTKKCQGIVFSCDNRVPNNLLSCIEDDGIIDVIKV